MRITRFAIIASVALLSACGGAAHPAATHPPRDRRIAQREEIEEALGQNVSNVYDFVNGRHPDWMHPATSGVLGQSQNPVVVYLDNVRQGDVSSLSALPLNNVIRIRFFTASEAEGEFGLNNTGGAIGVYTR